MEWLHTPLQIALATAMFVYLGLALWRGGADVRLAALGMVAGSLASAWLQDGSAPNVTQWTIMGVDAAYLALLCGIAWRSPRQWPVWAAAWQLAQTMSHVSMALNPGILGRAYIITSYVLFAGLLMALACGLRRAGEAGDGILRAGE